MANEFLNNRVAVQSFSLPSFPAGSTGSVITGTLNNMYIPAGAIVTKVGFVLGAQTDVSGFANAIFNVSVSNTALYSNNAVASVALSVGVVGTGTLAAPNGVLIGSTGGNPLMIFAVSGAGRSGISGNGTAFIGYIAAP